MARQGPLSMSFPRQEYWSGLSSPSARSQGGGDLTRILFSLLWWGEWSCELAQQWGNAHQWRTVRLPRVEMDSREPGTLPSFTQHFLTGTASSLTPLHGNGAFRTRLRWAPKPSSHLIVPWERRTLLSWLINYIYVSHADKRESPIQPPSHLSDRCLRSLKFSALGELNCHHSQNLQNCWRTVCSECGDCVCLYDRWIIHAWRASYCQRAVI